MNTKFLYLQSIAGVLLWIAVALIVLNSVTGCATLTGAVGPQVAKGINKYCAEPLAERLLLREQVNGMIAPNAVKVTCLGDAP